MVKKLSKTDQTAIKEAARKAEKRTTAEISIVMAPASDNYHEFVLFYSFILGGGIALVLNIAAVVTYYPYLLAIQIATMLLINLVPMLRRFCVMLVPRIIRHQRGSREAMREYHELHAQIAPPTPFVLLYVSLADHYVHVVTNPVVHKKIPGNWDSITRHFSAIIRQQGVRSACYEALKQIADILAAQFPAKS